MSTLKADTIQSTGGGATTLTNQNAAKVFSGVATTDATAGDNFNISSLVDNSTGNTTQNYTNALTSANYIATFGARSSGISDAYVNEWNAVNRTTTSIVTQAQSASLGSVQDISYAQMVIHGDLA